MYRLYPPAVCELDVVYFGFDEVSVLSDFVESEPEAAVADESAVFLVAAKTSAGVAIGATIAMVSIRVSIILAAVRMIVLFVSESVLFFITSGPSLCFYDFSALPERPAGKVSFTVKCPLRKPIIAPVFSEFSEHPLRKAVA